MNILIIRFSSLGDVALASAVVEALSRTMPDARLSFLTKQPYDLLFEDDPRLEHCLVIKDGERPTAIVDRISNGYPWDCVVDLHSSLRSRAVSALIKSPRKLRIRKHSMARRLMVFSRNRFRRTFDVLESSLETVRELGVTERIMPRIIPPSRAVERIDGLIGDVAPAMLAIAPGAKHTTKRWDVESFAEAADGVAERGLLPVFIGEAGDQYVVEQIRSRMTGESRTLAGDLDIAETAALIRRCRALITNDSGPMHIAGAVGVPFAAVFGPTHPDLGFVPGYEGGEVLSAYAPCSPCSVHGEKPCRMKRRFCMETVTADDVLTALATVFDA